MRGRRGRRWAALSTITALLGIPLLQAEAGPKEHQVKAAYLYNFTKFIEWPADAFADASTPITICLLGESPLADVLAKAIGGKRVRGRSLRLSRVDEGAMQSGGCQILFVSSSAAGRMDEILASASTAPVATVGEIAGFAARGGMLNFAVADSKVKVELNMGAAREAGLKVSGKLQQVAVAVGE